jgi:hypothetical protein
MAIDHLSCIALSAKRHRVADRGWSAAIEHTPDTEVRLPAEQSQCEVVVWHSETRTNDHVTFILKVRCSQHWLHGGFCFLSPAFMTIAYRFAERMVLRR